MFLCIVGQGCPMRHLIAQFLRPVEGTIAVLTGAATDVTQAGIDARMAGIAPDQPADAQADQRQRQRIAQH